MFTGLIETTGTVDRLMSRGEGAELVIRAPLSMVQALTLGESVAVDGACLTVTRSSGDRFWVDASSETMERTTLRERRVGDQLHLERALRLGDRLGGHWVTGHVDAVGTLRDKRPLGEALQLWFSAPSSVHRFLVEKGSIAIDGASLTVNEVDEHGFSVVLIPHTLSVLRLSEKRAGSSVNLEADILGKYVERLLNLSQTTTRPEQRSAHQSRGPDLDLSTLAKAGFIR